LRVMDRKLLITDLKGSLIKISQIITLLESYDNTSAGVELDLLQKNITVLFETYVKLKMSYEKQETHVPATKHVEIKQEPKPEIINSVKTAPVRPKEKES